jgi:hypothetical protein
MPAEETPPPVVDRQQNRVSGLTMPEAEPDVIALDVAATPAALAEAAIRALGG